MKKALIKRIKSKYSNGPVISLYKQYQKELHAFGGLYATGTASIYAEHAKSGNEKLKNLWKQRMVESIFYCCIFGALIDVDITICEGVADICEDLVDTETIQATPKVLPYGVLRFPGKGYPWSHIYFVEESLFQKMTENVLDHLKETRGITMTCASKKDVSNSYYLLAIYGDYEVLINSLDNNLDLASVAPSYDTNDSSKFLPIENLPLVPSLFSNCMYYLADDTLKEVVEVRRKKGKQRVVKNVGLWKNGVNIRVPSVITVNGKKITYVNDNVKQEKRGTKKRLHMVRGHWYQQAYGPGYQLHRRRFRKSHSRGSGDPRGQVYDVIE